MSVTITVEAGSHVKIMSGNSRRSESLMELMMRNKVTDAMLTTEVKAMLLDIMAIHRGQSLEEFISELEFKTARLHKEMLHGNVTHRQSHGISPEGRANQLEGLRRYHERKRAEKVGRPVNVTPEGVEHLGSD